MEPTTAPTAEEWLAWATATDHENADHYQALHDASVRGDRRELLRLTVEVLDDDEVELLLAIVAGLLAS